MASRRLARSRRGMVQEPDVEEHPPPPPLDEEPLPDGRVTTGSGRSETFGPDEPVEEPRRGWAPLA
jgi:hypothetical protein